ncbi:MAG TPA: ABC transporter permease [Opitutaceae bacterium]
MTEFLRALASRFMALFVRRRLESDMAEEMRCHVEELTRRNVEGGMTPEEARDAALRSFGSAAQIEERCRDEHGFAWVGQLLKDFGFALRSLCRARGYTLTVLFTLVLGIGVTSVVYELTSWIIFRAAPYPRAEELYLIGYKDMQDQAGSYLVGLQFQAYRDQTDVFSEFAAVSPYVGNVVVSGDPAIATIFSVTPDCFHVLGIRPVLGRGFLPAEFHQGAADVVIVSNLFWHRHFNGSPEAIGKKLMIDQRVCTVVGVLGPKQQTPPQFAADVYQPLVFKVDPANVFDPVLMVIARLRPGATVEQAVTELSAAKLPTIAPWAAAFFAGEKPALTKVTELNRPEIYWVLFAAAAFLFAIACLNAVNLMLIRLLGRRRELSIRFAIGGSRWQVVRLLLVESLLLSLASFVVVLFAARWLFPPLFNLLNGDDSASYTDYWNWGTLSFIGGLSALTCVATALVPTIRLFRADINTGLREGGPSLGEGRKAGRVRTFLVVLQATFAVILMTGTGLMIRSFEKLHAVDLGFDPLGKVKVSIEFPKGGEPKKGEVQLQLFQRLQHRLSLIPGVRAVSYSQDSLLEGAFAGTAQLQMADGTFRAVAGNFVSADFLQTAGLTMKAGRWLSGKRGVDETVINETLAKARFGDQNPVGQFIKLQVSGDYPLLVVGVVGNIRETLRAPAGMRLYSPDWEYPFNIKTLVLRLDRDPGKEFEGLVRRAIYEVDPSLIAPQIKSIDQAVTDMWSENYAYTILKGLTVIALGLTVVGLFSVIAYSVDSRKTEFGVRLAVGASPSDLNRLVMRRGLAAATAGLAIGAAGAAAMSRFMRSMLFETTPYDPTVYIGVALVLLAAAGAACYLPARRAARLDVVKLLKSE